MNLLSLTVLSDNDGFFSYPSGICLDMQAKVLYIADMHGSRICSLTQGGIKSALPNTTANGDTLCKPLAVCIAPDQTLYIADAGHNRLFRMGPSDPHWLPVKTRAYSFQLSAGIAVSPEGVLYATDFPENRLVQIAPDGNTAILAEDKTHILKPYGICLYQDKLFYTDTAHMRICAADIKTGEIHPFPCKIENPIAITLDKAGNAYISEPKRIHYLDTQKNTLHRILDKESWKVWMRQYGIENRICHIGALCTGKPGELFFTDTIKGCIYRMTMEIH